MRIANSKVDIDGRIVIGEGEIDEAPMLYIGEQVGTGERCGRHRGRSDRRHPHDRHGSVQCVGRIGGGRSRHLPARTGHVHGEAGGRPGGARRHRSTCRWRRICRSIAAQLGKPLSQLTVIVLAKPRHDGVIAQMQQLGVRVFAIPDGDVAAPFCCMPESEVDVMYGIGGAPEEVISAAVIRAGRRHAGAFAAP